MDLATMRAYAAAVQQPQQATGSSSDAAQAGAGVDFGRMVMDAVGSAEATLQSAEALSAQAVTGRADMVDVVTAVAAAEVQLETVVAVRDQVIRAYQEIMRMPI